MTEDNVSFIFEVMRMKLEHFFDSSNALDQKVAVVVGFLAAIVIGLSGFFKDRLQFSFCPVSTNFFSVGIGLLLIAVSLAIISLAARKYYYPPNESILYSEKTLNTDLLELKNQTIADMKEGFERNIATHQQKARLFNFTLLFSFLGLLFVLVDFFSV